MFCLFEVRGDILTQKSLSGDKRKWERKKTRMLKNIII